MSKDKHPEFTVIRNEELDTRQKPAQSSGYQTNPFYERLIKFANSSKRKRFTIEDLLK